MGRHHKMPAFFMQKQICFPYFIAFRGGTIFSKSFLLNCLTILQEKIKKPFLTKEQIRFGIEKFGKLDISTKEGKQRLIDGFINAIYVYDDKITFTFNYKDGTRTVMLSELSDGKNNSDLKCQGAPKRT